MSLIDSASGAFHKLTWRFARIAASVPSAIAAVLTEPAAHPWRFILTYLSKGDVDRRLRSSITLKRGDVPGLRMYGDQIRIGTAGAVIDLKHSNVTEGLLNGIIMQYLDVWYPCITRHPIPFFTGEGPYQSGQCTIRPGDVVIDAGANFGIFTWYAAEQVGDAGIVLAFEPSSSCVNLLRQSVRSSTIGNRVRVVQKGLAARASVTHFTAEDLSAGNVPVAGDPSIPSERVELVSLDEYARHAGLSRVDFIKADIEGMEVDLLIGAEQVIRKNKPRISICTYHAANHRQLLTELLLSYRSDYQIVYSAAKLHAW